MSKRGSPPPPDPQRSFEDRRQFLRLGPNDAVTLKALGDHLRPLEDEIIDGFYAHLEQFEQTRELLREPGRIARLREIQRAYFRQLFEGDYGDAYAQGRRQVGLVHHRIGLAPEFYLGAYNLYLQLILPRILADESLSAERTSAVLGSLAKIVFFDLGLTIDTYIEAATNALSTSRTHLERVLEAISDALLVVDEEGTVVDANREFLDLTGHQRDEVVGRPVRIFFGEADDTKIRERMRHVVEKGSIHDDRVLQAKDGSRIPVAFSGSAITDPAGRVLGFVGCMRDMRERNRLLAELEDANTRLEERVEQRTRELQRAQHRLILSEKLSAVGQLAAGIAHEVGTPLNIISGRAEYLLEELGDDPRGKNLKVIIGQIDRISGLIEQLLDFARERSDEMGPVNLSRSVESLIPLLEGKTKKLGITFATHVGHLPDAHANSNRVQQVLLNLLMNAVDAIREARPGGPGKIEIAGSTEPNFVVLQIRDDGAGIEAEMIPRIFEPFFTTKPVGQGTGLGLSVTYGLLEEMGGSISVRSQRGHGSCFTVRLRPYRPSWDNKRRAGP